MQTDNTQEPVAQNETISKIIDCLALFFLMSAGILILMPIILGFIRLGW